MTTDTPNKSVQIVVCVLNNWRMHVNCTGLDEPLDTSKFEALRGIMNEFGRECHLTFIWFAGFIGSIETVRSQLEANVEPDGWIGVASERLDLAHTRQARRGVAGCRGRRPIRSFLHPVFRDARFDALERCD